MRLIGLCIAVSLIFAAIVGTSSPSDAEGESLELHCAGADADVGSMESEYLEQGCWGHLGIHTYFVGNDTVYSLHGGAGMALSVEQQFSPPVENPSAQAWPPQTFTPLPIETSLDGLKWQEVAHAEYMFAGIAQGGNSMRQQIEFSFDTPDDPLFRYLRIRQPLSAAQGLSGYIDASSMTLDVTDMGDEAPLRSVQKVSERSCQRDIMEAVWVTHPCWYGGVNRWDAPSFFHTYPLGRSVLDRVEGTALFAYWRAEDPGTCCGQSFAGMLGGPVLLQSSTNGENWEDLATFNATYGVPLEFSVDLDAHEASLLRLVSEKHPGYGNHPALKHPEAYLLHSELSLSGTLPGS